MVLALWADAVCLCQAQNYPPEVKDIRIGESNLPIIFINTLGHEIEKENRVSAWMKIVNNPDGINYDDTLAHPNQTIDYEGYIGVRYRGNSSFSYSAKKPYSIKLLTDSYENNGTKRNAPLLGMGTDNDWALLAPYNDRSLIRNALSFSLAEGYFEYVPKSRFCELILDGVYYGVHCLTEKVARGDDRLNIKKAGDSGEADQSRAVVALIQGDYAKASTLLESAERKGVDVTRNKDALIRMKSQK